MLIHRVNCRSLAFPNSSTMLTSIFRSFAFPNRFLSLSNSLFNMTNTLCFNECCCLRVLRFIFMVPNYYFDVNDCYCDCDRQIYVWISYNSAKLGHMYAAASTRPVSFYIPRKLVIIVLLYELKIEYLDCSLTKKRWRPIQSLKYEK